jgi:hypothetical protein
MSATTTGPRRVSSAGHTQPRGRLSRLVRGPAQDPRWARPALLALLAATAVLYAAGLSRNSWANDFYSAAVQAGTRSWKAFFFGSFDAANFITVDKTPAAQWVMELSARVFGLNYWSVLLPQAAEGVAATAILYATVRRWSGPAAGLLAAAAAAVTPVATLIFRFNNPDALLVLLMTAAAYAVTRAVESGRTRWIVLAGALARPWRARSAARADGLVAFQAARPGARRPAPPASYRVQAPAPAPARAPAQERAQARTPAPAPAQERAPAQGRAPAQEWAAARTPAPARVLARPDGCPAVRVGPGQAAVPVVWPAALESPPP